MRRSDCGKINTEAVLEQASGRIHSPEDRFKTKGGVSGQDNETRTFSGAKGITGRPELGIGICAICVISGSEGVPQFKHKIDPRHGHVIRKLTRGGGSGVIFVEEIIDRCPHLKTLQLFEEVLSDQSGVGSHIV